jgi:hypothetical protein
LARSTVLIHYDGSWTKSFLGSTVGVRLAVLLHASSTLNNFVSPSHASASYCCRTVSDIGTWEMRYPQFLKTTIIIATVHIIQKFWFDLFQYKIILNVELNLFQILNIVYVNLTINLFYFLNII